MLRQDQRQWIRRSDLQRHERAALQLRGRAGHQFQMLYRDVCWARIKREGSRPTERRQESQPSVLTRVQSVLIVFLRLVISTMVENSNRLPLTGYGSTPCRAAVRS